MSTVYHLQKLVFIIFSKPNFVLIFYISLYYSIFNHTMYKTTQQVTNNMIEEGIQFVMQWGTSQINLHAILQSI